MNKGKIIYSIGKFLILLLAITLSSCSTDSEEGEEETPSNDKHSIKVDGNSYELSKAFVYFGHYPEEGNETALYYHEIILAPSDVYLNEANQSFTRIEDSHAVVMTVTSRSSSSITDGAYSVGTWSDKEEFKMVRCYKDTSSSRIDLEGTVTIQQEGKKISFQFDDLTSENDDEVSGSYNGEFKQFDFYLN